MRLPLGFVDLKINIFVIASGAKQSRAGLRNTGLLRRFASRG
jgi:hypothetical protein